MMKLGILTACAALFCAGCDAPWETKPLPNGLSLVPINSCTYVTDKDGFVLMPADQDIDHQKGLDRVIIIKDRWIAATVVAANSTQNLPRDQGFAIIDSSTRVTREVATYPEFVKVVQDVFSLDPASVKKLAP